MTTSARVVITGFGLVTPLGQTPEAVWQSMLTGRSGVRQIRSFDTTGMPTCLGAEIDDFDAKGFVEKSQRKSLRMMARPIQMAIAAAQLALTHGQVDKSKLDPARFGIEFDAGLIPSDLSDVAEAALVSANCQPGVIDMLKWGEKGMTTIQPLWMLKYLPNMPACHISILHDAQGPNNTLTESDASSLLALIEASRILRRDGADFFLVGGCESKLNPLSLVRQCLFEQVSRRNQEPERACRPFDRQRDGLVVSEGSSVLTVESLEHAKKRGASRIWAEVVGCGAAFDVKTDGAGLARAVETALKQASIDVSDLDHVCAHGLSTSREDRWEAQGLARVLGTRVPVFAAKGYFGNLGAASGSTEVALSVMALHNGVLPGSLNHDETDPGCPILVHRGEPRAVGKPYALKVAFTHQGQCGAVVIRKWEGS